MKYKYMLFLEASQFSLFTIKSYNPLHIGEHIKTNSEVYEIIGIKHEVTFMDKKVKRDSDEHFVETNVYIKKVI